MNDQQRQLLRMQQRFSSGNLLMPQGRAPYTDPHALQSRAFAAPYSPYPSEVRPLASLSGTPFASSFATPLVLERHLASAKKESDDDAPKEKKKKKKKRDEDDGSTSDGSDAGSCWSNYERTPGTEKYAKGSCRPKKKKKQKSD